MPARKQTTTVEEPEAVETQEPENKRSKLQLNRQWLQTVQGGNQHPTWKLVLDALHQLGLKSIETTVEHYPTESENYAAAKARITLEDGSVFEDYGFASPENIPNKMIAKHLVHMAVTRAKGRAGRDAINVAEALLEEMGENAPNSGAFAPVKKNPLHDQIDELWASNDTERKSAVKAYIVENSNQPLKTLADLHNLPDELLEKALAVA